MTSDEEAVWLYAVIRDDPAPWVDGLTGVGDGALWTVSAAGLTAVVETVALADFGEEVLPTRLEDMGTLAALARAHDVVVETAVRYTTVAPMRLATMYFDDPSVRRMLEEHRAEFNEVLDLIDGCAEWGVKGYVSSVTRQAEEQPQPQQADTSTRAGGGAAYLRQRREQLTSKRDSENLAYQGAESIHTALTRLAKRHRRHKPQDPKLTGADTPMVLNGAYLVPHQQIDEFGAAVVELGQRQHGVRLELTGPWPAYSFTGGQEVPI